MKRMLFYAAVMTMMHCCDPLISRAQYSGQVKYIEAPQKGTVTVESTGFGAKRADSDLNAGATALYTLLFRGLPGSIYELPMIPNETAKKDDAVIRDLLKGGYGSFVMADVLQHSEVHKKKTDGEKGILTIHDITFNYEALRRYLEEHNVIKRFGY